MFPASMPRFEHLFFVCTNERPPDSPRGCCAARGGEALLARLKALVQEHRLAGKVRVVRSGCLDLCAKGCVVAAFSARRAHPETWYTGLAVADAEALFLSHVQQDTPLPAHLELRATERQEIR